MAVDISGMDKAVVLAALHNGTRAIGMGTLHDLGRDITVEEAQTDLDRCNPERLYFDYYHGRPLKVDITGDEIPREDLYDRDSRQGACANAIAKARAAA